MMGWLKGKQQAKQARKREKDAGVKDDTPKEETPAKQPARFSRWTQSQRDNMTMHARTRPRNVVRWRIMSGGPDHEIDLNQPQVRLEWELCDIDNLRLVYRGRHTDEFLNKLPPECRTLYYEKDPDGKTYAETVENPRFFAGFLKGIGILVKGDKKAVEQLLKEIDEADKAETEN